MIDTSLTVVAVAGSLRRDSWNRRLLAAAADRAPAGLDLLPSDDLASLPLFDEDLERPDPEADPEPVRAFRRRLAAADGLLVATPEYNQGLPGVLKNGLDWLSRPYGASCLEGKPAAVLGATPGAWGTRLAQKELRHVLWACGALVLPAPPLYLARVAERFADGEVDERLGSSLSELLAAFARWIHRVGAGT